MNVLQDSDRSLPHSDLNYFLCCVFVRTGGFFFLFFARIMFLKFLIFFPICEKPKWKNTFSVELFFSLQKIQEFINMFFFICVKEFKKNSLAGRDLVSVRLIFLRFFLQRIKS